MTQGELRLMRGAAAMRVPMPISLWAGYLTLLFGHAVTVEEASRLLDEYNAWVRRQVETR